MYKKVTIIICCTHLNRLEQEHHTFDIWLWPFQDLLNIGSLLLSSSYQDALDVLDTDRLFWVARTSHTCACAWRIRTFARHAIRLNQTGQISCSSVMFSRDKWMEARWLSMESLHWSRLVIPDIPLESPQRSLYGRDRKHDILFSDRHLFNLICQPRRQKFNHARKLGFSQD